MDEDTNKGVDIVSSWAGEWGSTTSKDKHPARMVADGIEAAMMQMNDERWFASEQERRFFWRLAAVIRRNIERELHSGVEETKIG